MFSNKKELLMKNMNWIRLPLITVVCASLLVLFMTPSLFAADFTIQNGAAAAQGAGQPAELFGTSGIFTTVTNILLFVIGALSVIMLIVGGLRYTISGGNASAVTAAKNTILYAIVGLVVALLAFAIINFILVSLVPSTSGLPTTT